MTPIWFSDELPPPNTRFRATFYDESGYTDFIRDEQGRFFFADKSIDEEEITCLCDDYEGWFEAAGYMYWEALPNHHTVIETTKQAWIEGATP